MSGAERAPARNVELEAVQLIPETDALSPGDRERVLVNAPFSPSEAVIIWRRGGLLHTERRRLEGPTTTVELPITDAMTPDVTLQVDLVGQAARTDDDGKVLDDKPKRVAHATGALSLKVAPVRRTLEVAVTPAAEALAPGHDTELSLLVTDADGQPVQGEEVAVIMVDEAVLSLTGYQLPNPLAAFYAVRGAGVSDHRLRQWVALADPDRAEEVTALEKNKDGVGGLIPATGLGRRGAGEGGGGVAYRSTVRTRSGELAQAESSGRIGYLADEDGDFWSDGRTATLDLLGANLQTPAGGQQVSVREDFGATALFAPSVVTDAGGKVTVPFTLPDSLTRYRVMAVAVHDQAMGSDEAALTARLPLMVRPSLPRFLNSGDQAELPVVLENQTDAAMEVQVAMGVTNLALIDGLTPSLQPAGDPRRGWTVTVPARDRVEVRFPATTDEAGTARVQVVAGAGRHRDAARLELPVYTPATTEAFATPGSLTDAGLKQRVTIPDDVWAGYGGLEVTTSSTQLQALTDAVIYLEFLPLRGQRAAGEPPAVHRRAAGGPRRLRGGGAAGARGPRGAGPGRPRPAGPSAASQRWLRLLAEGRRAMVAPVDPRRHCVC